MREPYLGVNRSPQRVHIPRRVPSVQRVLSPRRVPSPRRLPMITGVSLLLLLGVLGFSARRAHSSAHAPVSTPAGHVEPRFRLNRTLTPTPATVWSRHGPRASGTDSS